MKSRGGVVINDITARIRQAIENLKTYGPPGYWQGTLEQRAELSGQARGSVYQGIGPDDLEALLLGAIWEPYEHPGVMHGCAAFRAALPGTLGIVGLDSLDPNAIVTYRAKRGTDEVYPVVQGVRGEIMDFTVLMLGQHEGHEVVFTFHPGDPVAPSHVLNKDLDGQQETVAEALRKGFATAKIE